MPRIAYIQKDFRADPLAVIQICARIITGYHEQGFRLTLRQLYYQLVARDIIQNKQSEYNRLGSVINDARLAGLIDWQSIEDRTRNVEINSHSSTPSEIIRTAANSYRRGLWASQSFRPEVWVEKDALEGVVESACRPLDVPFFSCRGYTSQTAMWEAAERLMRYQQNVVVFHLGDHDPSGIELT